MTLAEAEKVEMELIENGTEGVEAWRVLCALMCFYRYYKDTCKAENRLNDEGTTDKGMDIPESPNEVKNSDLLEKMLVLLGRVIDLERRIERTEKSVDALFRITDSQKDSIRNLIDSVDMLLNKVREK